MTSPTEVSASKETIVDNSSQANANTSQVSETSFRKSGKKMTSRFDGLGNELLNLKDVVIKILQVENERLRQKVNVLESKFNF